MEEREVHLVMNPVADRGRSVGRHGIVSRFMEEHGVTVVWHVTRGPGHAGCIVEGLPDGALVVAVGGDGTVHEVAASCVGRDLAMGVLPVGSGNDYVKALGVGTDLGRALDVLVGGRIRSVDAGEVNGIRFNNGLGIGFDAAVAAGVAEAPARLGGTGRYLWSVGRLLWGFRCNEAALKLDGEEVIETRTILVAAALGTTYGARFRLAPEARLHDRLFDVVWSEELNRAEAMRLGPAALGGTPLRHPKAHIARARKLRVELAEEVAAHVDGEPLEPTRVFRARVLPGALRVLGPRGEDEPPKMASRSL